ASRAAAACAPSARCPPPRGRTRPRPRAASARRDRSARRRRAATARGADRRPRRRGTSRETRAPGRRGPASGTSARARGRRPAPRRTSRDVLAGVGRLAALPLADLAQPGQVVRSQRAELLLVDLAQLEPHLRGEELLAQARVVVHLGIDRSGDLAEHELDPGGEHAVEDDHFPSFALSSFRRMLTKLYGGQGPVYLKVSLSCL